MMQGSPELLGRLLKDVSRSFYLTLRVLPGPIRPQIGLAYLLARASDTIADTDALEPGKRLKALEAFGRRVCGENSEPLDLEDVAGNQSSPAERALLKRIEEAFAVLAQLDVDDQRRVQDVLRTILSGQTLDVQRFASATPSRIAALRDDAELDDYIYRVAGCVGEFWTRMCRAHLFPRAALDDAFLREHGIRFGKGLQMVNVLRDLAADLRIGRCYLPTEELRRAGLTPADLLDPAVEPRLRPVYGRYLDLAQRHLEAGWAYTNHLPVRAVRVRLACAWPILIGMETLAALRRAEVLDPDRRVRISRKQVQAVLLRSVVWYPWQGRWRRLVPSPGLGGGNALPDPKSLAK